LRTSFQTIVTGLLKAKASASLIKIREHQCEWSGPLLVIGQMALAAKPELKKGSVPFSSKRCFFAPTASSFFGRATGVYLAGRNDQSHCFAVAEPMRAWAFDGSCQAHPANASPKTQNSPLVTLKSLIQRPSDPLIPGFLAWRCSGRR
jgi:hypothetical protein